MNLRNLMPKYITGKLERELNVELSMLRMEADQSTKREKGKDLAARLDGLVSEGYNRLQIKGYMERLDSIITTGHDPHPRADLPRNY